MPRDADSLLAADFPEVLRKIRERTPARIFAGPRRSRLSHLHAAGFARSPCRRARCRPRGTRSGSRLWRGVRQTMESIRGLHRGAFQGRISPAAGPGTALERSSRQELVKGAVRGATTFKLPSATAFRSRRSPRKFRRSCRCWRKERGRAAGPFGKPFVIRHCRVGILE